MSDARDEGLLHDAGRLDLEELSALLDGEVDDAAAGRAASAWRESSQVRDRWHAWSVIGDSLRSDDLATSGARDEAFLQSLRARLASEPVVMAPGPQAALPRRVRWTQWAAPVAVAAGFVAVMGALVGLRSQDAPTDWAGSMFSSALRSPAASAAASAVYAQDAATTGRAQQQPVFVVIAPVSVDGRPPVWQPIRLQQAVAAVQVQPQSHAGLGRMSVVPVMAVQSPSDNRAAH